MAEKVILDGITKAYQANKLALCDVSLEVPDGTFLVLLGPSGSGKTTLLRCIAGIEHISSGQMTIGNKVVADNRLHVPPENRGLAMVFQDYALWPHLVVLDNVAFAMRRRRIGKAASKQLAFEMLRCVGLEPLASRYPSELSGGEQQRVALARALVADTGLLLCDEPLSNLDADLRERMRVEISTLVRQAGATTIYITHDQAEAFALADLVGVLEAGRLVQLGTPEQIYAGPASPFVARFTGLAAEFDVQVSRQVRDQIVEVNLAGWPERSIHATIVKGGYRSGPGTMMIRPAAVKLCSGHGNDHHLRGLVSDVAFRGRGYEHAIELEDGTKMNGVFSNLRVGRGEAVGVRFEHQGCLVFPTPLSSSIERDYSSTNSKSSDDSISAMPELATVGRAVK